MSERKAARWRAAVRWALTQHRVSDEESAAELNRVRAMFGRKPTRPAGTGEGDQR